MLLGLHFFIGIPGSHLDLQTQKLLQEIQPGGIILFGRNIRSGKQLADLTQRLRQLLGQDLLICLDHEGGRVNRLKDIVGVVPSAMQLGFLKREDWARQHGHLTGRLLREVGVNINLAPVLDLWLCPKTDNSVPDRCWSRDPYEVASLAGAFLYGMQQEGVIGCGKHFLGYGAADKDPHLFLPRVNRTRQQILKQDLFPYTALLPSKKQFAFPFTPKCLHPPLQEATASWPWMNKGVLRSPALRDEGGLELRRVPPKYQRCHGLLPVGLHLIMLSHAHLSAFHGNHVTPACVSPKITGTLLRKTLGFHGVAITDDLEMGAITQIMTVGEATVQCLKNGADLILICHTANAIQQGFQTAQKALDKGHLSPQILQKSQRRIKQLQKYIPCSGRFSERCFQLLLKDIQHFTQKIFHALPPPLRVIDECWGAIGEKY